MKKITKAIIFTGIPLILIFCGALFLAKQKSDTIVGFYDIPDICQQEIKEIITESNLKVRFVELDEKAYTSNKLNKKIDFVISFNDAVIQKNLKNAVEISEDIKNRFPKSIKESKFYCKNEKFVVEPVLLDQFEAGIVKTIYQRYKISNPVYFTQFGEFAKELQAFFPIPMVCAGSEDINVNSLFTLFVEAFGGQAGYDKMAEKLSATSDFSSIYNYKIEGDADEDLTVRDLLLIIKDWQSKGLLENNWYERTPEDTGRFIDNGDVAVSFMNLSEHRTKPVLNGKYYYGYTIPEEYATERYSIQPAIVAVSFTNSETTRIIQNRLSLQANQEKLSENTKLAPATLQGEAYDSLSNNARFLAASIKGGPVPDLGTYALTSQKQRHQLAEAIRNYCQI